MKITNSDVIKSGEKDLIDSITADLDWGAIEKVFLTEHNLGIDEDIEYKKGDIIAYNNQVAYKLEFTVKVNLSVLINREGEYLSVKISEKMDENGFEDNSQGKNDQKIECHDPGTIAKIDEPEPVLSVDLSEKNADKIVSNNGQEVREDKYMEALAQLGPDNPVE
jgi:hypothetical protein